MRICDPLIYAEDAKKYTSHVSCKSPLRIFANGIPRENAEYVMGGGGGSYVNFLGI